MQNSDDCIVKIQDEGLNPLKSGLSAELAEEAGKWVWMSLNPLKSGLSAEPFRRGGVACDQVLIPSSRVSVPNVCPG